MLFHTTNHENPEDPIGIHQYYLNIINNMPNNVYWLDKNCVTQGCNANVLKLVGLSKLEDFIGITYEQMGKLAGWTEGQAQSFKKDDMEVISTGKPKVNVEEPPLYDDSGNAIYYVSTRVPLFDQNGEVIGVCGISVDITQRKKMEEQLRISKEKAEAANKAKTVFIANMSHDVRTPLSGVIGTSDILEHEGDTEKDRELGHTIHISAERLLQLLDDVLEVISADETGETSLKFTTFDLKKRLDFINELLTPSAQTNHIALNFFIDKNVPKYIMSDRIKIDRILLNLISNALKFTHSGSINVSVKNLKKENQKNILEFNVTDTGIGIPEDQIGKIFERFYRVSPSFENKYKGHGIGLFIVHKYVDLLKGNISVQSKEGEGTNFRVTLPVKVGKAADVKDSEEAPSFVAPNIKNKQAPGVLPTQTSFETNKKKQTTGAPRVLVVEDDAVARRVVKSILERAGFEVIDVETAELGFWQVMNNSYDLILTDIGLPGMSGNELTTIIRTWEKVTQHSRLPIVGLSAHGAKQQSDAKEAGMDLLLSKPINDEKVKFIKAHFLNADKEILEEDKSSEGQTRGLGFELPQNEEELFNLENYPLLNEEEGIAAAGGSIEMLNELLVMLINETFPEELALLKKAHEQDDWDTIQSVAHKVKGAALHCGTVRLRYACQFTERYRLAGHNKLLEDLYQQLILVLIETAEFVENRLRKKNA